MGILEMHHGDSCCIVSSHDASLILSAHAAAGVLAMHFVSDLRLVRVMCNVVGFTWKVFSSNRIRGQSSVERAGATIEGPMRLGIMFFMNRDGQALDMFLYVFAPHVLH